MAMDNYFDSVSLPAIRTNQFDLSHRKKMSFYVGELVPTMCLEVYPGDTFQLGVQSFMRLAPMTHPIMHEVRVDHYYFFVPYRILWAGWEDFITGANNDTVPPYFHRTTSGQFDPGTLFDYLGISNVTDNDERILAFAPSAYLKIFDDYFRDTRLMDEVWLPLVAGDNSTTGAGILTNATIKKGGWNRDMFTTAFPYPQEGEPVNIPVISEQDALVVPVDSPINPARWKTAPGTGSPGSGTVATESDGDTDIEGVLAWLDPRGTLKADIEGTAITLEQLRIAIMLQEFGERDLLGGTRYTEILWSHFMEKSSDARLQRAEYIGSIRGSMTISEVLATAQTETTEGGETPLGTMGGHGVGFVGDRGLRFHAEEHGVLMGICCVKPTTAYQDGLPRMYSRFEREDFYWPTFANISQQPIYNRELFCAGTVAENATIFGYRDAWGELKTMVDTVHGEFKNDLSQWHWGRIFTDPPVLDSQFMLCVPDDRIFAVQDGSHNIYAHIAHNVYASRKLPVHSTPHISSYS